MKADCPSCKTEVEGLDAKVGFKCPICDKLLTVRTKKDVIKPTKPHDRRVY